VDKAGPVISITSPPSGASYYVGQTVKAAFSVQRRRRRPVVVLGVDGQRGRRPHRNGGVVQPLGDGQGHRRKHDHAAVSYVVANRLCAVVTAVPKTTTLLFTVQLCDSAGHNLTTSKDRPHRRPHRRVDDTGVGGGRSQEHLLLRAPW